VSLFTRSRSGLRVRPATPRDVDPVLAFLDGKPAENVFLSYLVRRDRFAHNDATRTWTLATNDGEVRGVCLAASNVVPAVADAQVARALAEGIGDLRPATQSLVGERSAVDALWEGVRARAPRVRLVREEQPVYVIERSGRAAPGAEAAENGESVLRAARDEDLDLLVEAAADMLREEILDDPYRRDPIGFRTQVWRMIQDRAIYVLEAGGRVVFKAHANVRTPLAVQVSGVYTLPAHRSRGYARAGMAALAARLLRHHPLVCLYVNLENQAAMRAYEAVGFVRAGTFKSIFFGNR
jgi:predicted GNAT family acetyltransferase